MIISVINQKGGVGKTVTTINLAVSLARHCRVLVIDTDPQYSLSAHFETSGENDGEVTLPNSAQPSFAEQNFPEAHGMTPDKDIYHVLLEECPLSAAVRSLQPNLEIVPSSPAMVIADQRLPHEPGGDLRLRRALRTPTWDICLIDCPSGWGSIVHNALLASTHVIIPINSAPEALDVAHDTLTRAQRLFEAYEQPIPHFGFLLTMFRETLTAHGIDQQTRETWPAQTFATRIRNTEEIKKLALFRKTVADWKASTAREDYYHLAEELQHKWHGTT